MGVGRRYVVPEEVLTRRVEGRRVFLHLDRERWYGLGELGTAVVEGLLSDELEGAIERLLVTYDVSDVRLRADIGSLLGDLVDAGLLEVRGEVDA